MKITIEKQHMSMDICGILDMFRGRSMRGIIEQEGKGLSDREARNYLNDCLSKGYKVIPMSEDDECPEFDYFGGGCPGHGIHYYNDDDKEITKEEYDKITAERGMRNEQNLQAPSYVQLPSRTQG